MSLEFAPELLRYLQQCRKITVLTGAGVSAESGIPTFRDAQTGLWARFRPQELASPQAFTRNPAIVWDWYAYRRGLVAQAQPNPGHFALVKMERHVEKFTLITQNIDNLHQAAGSQNVIELHGNIAKVRCAECGTFATEWDDTTQKPPRCSECGGLLRPHVVWFGETLPQAELQAAVRATETCDAFFSIGTSGVVEPAASLPFVALKKKALVIEINLEPTPLTTAADYAFAAPSGQVLPELVRTVWG